jgi:hypothetical protein
VAGRKRYLNINNCLHILTNVLVLWFHSISQLFRFKKIAKKWHAIVAQDWRHNISLNKYCINHKGLFYR